jgi:hypothetical protein
MVFLLCLNSKYNNLKHSRHICAHRRQTLDENVTCYLCIAFFVLLFSYQIKILFETEINTATTMIDNCPPKKNYIFSLCYIINLSRHLKKKTPQEKKRLLFPELILYLQQLVKEFHSPQSKESFGFLKRETNQLFPFFIFFFVLSTMPPQEPMMDASTLLRSQNPSSESLDMMRSDYVQGSMKK